MIKESLRSGIGVLLCILFSISGWFFTTSILSEKEQTLLQKSGTRPLTLQMKSSNPSLFEEASSYPTVSLGEIFHILTIWQTSNQKTPHEPFGGQLTMEQAVAVCDTFLAALAKDGGIPYTPKARKVDAYLCSNTPNITALIPETPAGLGTVRPEEELLPYYSYWTVHLSQDGFQADFQVNGATGQVWSAELRLPATSHSADMNSLLTVFLQQLMLDRDALQMEEGERAVRSFGEGALLAAAESFGTEDGQKLTLSLKI